ncbi:MBL fold metallo-hydrolase [Candidatus Latescibacterota bacterium]
MTDSKNINLDYDRPIQIAEGVYWVGFYDREAKLHCNPYLIIEGDEAVLIDSGSRPDFSTVMMKVLQTGVDPHQIKALIYHHPDPDLCGNIPNFEDLIDRDDLILISDKQNIPFIRHYNVASSMISLEESGHSFEFSSGRKLEFYNTPYAHSSGAFITFDTKTKTLFTSDILGSFAKEWELYLSLDESCAECNEYKNCVNNREYCPLPDILSFHEYVMTSSAALRNAIDIIRKTEFEILAPQHGSVVNTAFESSVLLDKLRALDSVGIDRILQRCE